MGIAGILERVNNLLSAADHCLGSPQFSVLVYLLDAVQDRCQGRQSSKLRVPPEQRLEMRINLGTIKSAMVARNFSPVKQLNGQFMPHLSWLITENILSIKSYTKLHAEDYCSTGIQEMTQDDHKDKCC